MNNMQRVVSLNIPLNEDILNTVKLYNVVSNLHIKKAIELKTNSKKKLHDSLYKNIRKLFPAFPSALVQCARDNAIEMLKGNKHNGKTLKNSLSSIRFDLRTSKVFLDTGHIQLTLLGGRQKFNVEIPEYFSKYSDWKVKGVQLGIFKGNCRLRVIIEKDIPMPIINNKILGIDLGIKNIVTCSDKTIIKSNSIRKVKRKYSFNRRKLQSVGTRSAKRKLKRVSGREKRYMIDINHKLSKQIVNKDFGIFAMENLKGIREQKKGKKINRMLSNWSFYQLREFIEYKAEVLGKRVELVNPEYTSQRCSACSCIAKSNRKGGLFHCKSCGFVNNADVNASINISCLVNLDEQALVNEPIVSLLVA